VVLLIGELGAGKTTLTKGIVEGLHAAAGDDVSSPTFTLIHEYGDPPKVYHVDLYRLNTVEEARRLGLDETRSLLSSADLERLRNRFEASNQRLLTALGRNDNSTPLRLDARSDTDSYCDLKQFCASESYAHYRELTDAIYTRRNRSHRPVL